MISMDRDFTTYPRRHSKVWRNKSKIGIRDSRKQQRLISLKKKRKEKEERYKTSCMISNVWLVDWLTKNALHKVQLKIPFVKYYFFIKSVNSKVWMKYRSSTAQAILISLLTVRREIKLTPSSLDKLSHFNHQKIMCLNVSKEQNLLRVG